MHRISVFSTGRSALRICVLASFICALVAVSVNLSGCGGGRKEGTIGVDPLKSVYVVENNVQLLGTWAQLGVEADVLIRFDTSDDMMEFPFSHMENMRKVADDLKRGNTGSMSQYTPMLETGGTVNLGYVAGMFDRVVWVMPLTKSIGDEPLDGFKQFLREKRGYREDALVDLAIDGKHITGSLAGVPLTVTNFEDMSVGGEKAVLDVDLAFFGGMKALDPAYQPGTRSLLGFLKDLKGKNIRTNLVTVTLSTLKGNVPMDIRYFGRMITEALGDPSILGETANEKWSMMMEAEDSLVAGSYGTAESLYMLLVKGNPAEPGLYFSLAVARGFQDKGIDCRDALFNAFQLDGAYLRGFFQLASVLAVNGKVETGITILELPDLNTILSPSEMTFQKGIYFMTAGRPRAALEHLKRLEQQRPDDFALQTVIYRAYSAAADKGGMASTLTTLIDLNEERVARDMPWVFKELGKLQEEGRMYGPAAENYEKYLSIFPDDSEAPELQSRIDTWKKREQ